MEWLPTESQRTSIFVGKIDSVLGIEYRDRKANQRFGITPSLMARYTTGTALGLKVRTKFGDNDWLVLAGALTNGSNTTEQFHFYDEIDSNAGKTASGRLSMHAAPGLRVEMGVSGSVRAAGSRARQPGTDVVLRASTCWRTGGASISRRQWLQGHAAGEPSHERVRAGAATTAATWSWTG